jgi:hypothetical protein
MLDWEQIIPETSVMMCTVSKTGIDIPKKPIRNSISQGISSMKPKYFNRQ